MSILRTKGIAVADSTQMVAVAGFLPMFFFLTLYMQTVLGYSPIQTGAAYLPLTAGFIVASGISSQLFHRIGTKPVIVAGAMVAAGGLYWLSTGAGSRLVCLGHPARPRGRLPRPRRRLRRRDHLSQRRCLAGQGRPRSRPAQHGSAAWRRPAASQSSPLSPPSAPARCCRQVIRPSPRRPPRGTSSRSQPVPGSWPPPVSSHSSLPAPAKAWSRSTSRSWTSPPSGGSEMPTHAIDQRIVRTGKSQRTRARGTLGTRERSSDA